MHGIKKPEFFIVGAPKCGTTALFICLKQHPCIFMPSIKGRQCFADDILGDLRVIRTLQDYCACYSNSRSDLILGEASVAYLGSPAAVRRIAAFQPGARIIIMLRNPVDVMYSEYSQRIYDLREPAKPFEQALQAEKLGQLSEWRQKGSTVIGLGRRETVRFSHQVRMYLRAFDRSCIHFIIYDDFRRDTDAVYRDVLRFLGVRADFQPEVKVVNSNKRVRSFTLQRWLHHPSTLVRRIAHLTLPQRWRKIRWRFITSSKFSIRTSPTARTNSKAVFATTAGA
ncbi:MAG: sulfotransferase domain-containing protein [Bryobacterales bacterium]|nr:sulfotransferase domain-containing protein [Bryobacterales bacterium]MBV9401250.1 sulfotransferase domain-containing protein [Bryobacterales bacterium]